ncbi:hypothetical protein [Streptomyces sp. NPDC045470]
MTAPLPRTANGRLMGGRSSVPGIIVGTDASLPLKRFPSRITSGAFPDYF